MKALTTAAAAVVVCTATVAGTATAVPAMRAPAGGFEELWVPSSMGPIKVQVQWAARGGGAALYLLDGLRAPGDHSQWTTDTDALRQFAGDDVTLVFPVGGHSSFYTDWYRPSSTNRQATTYKWETFLTRELPDFLAGYGVSRTNNAIVGASMGGNAALVLAAHHRDQFRFAGSFSGFVNPTYPLWNQAMRAAMIDEGNFNVDDMWGPAGDPAWARNDATVQAELLRGLPIYVSTGNGLPGPLDLPNGIGNTINAMGLEATSATAAGIFRDRVTALGISARVDILNGTHTWPYWQQSLATARPMILAALSA
ncbi:antigen 85-C precursor [Nocardia neocaledoniensis NBRC 108232]|uniref:Diacylglycerol O-acyltransferase/trehalose O-mycolyltransferase n=1 Tax=Nocardia neocaledoniensis TaxID=236511 RepID=A0A317N4D2_9NOCA|nr:alpha/beta hydrolase family protein [Nocardia neocaledoniensis]PWV70141.1 diacylglycerol O-acyltransferase/trehalose O-mycolyltransferase [Nocardia neocaledoniensis]GEM34157.1 antigen 85-C precursor [Nocardia neocaledoniensis NBRC 108232]